MKSVNDLVSYFALATAGASLILWWHTGEHLLDRKMTRSTHAGVTAARIKDLYAASCHATLSPELEALLQQLLLEYNESAGREYSWNGCRRTVLEEGR